MHTTYMTDLRAGLRKTPVETTWTNKTTLGSGGYGTVFLQEAEGGHQLRAVKRLEKKKKLIGIDVELKVMSKVAHVFTYPSPWTAASCEVGAKVD